MLVGRITRVALGLAAVVWVWTGSADWIVTALVSFLGLSFVVGGLLANPGLRDHRDPEPVSSGREAPSFVVTGLDPLGQGGTLDQRSILTARALPRSGEVPRPGWHS
jgi:hypothetical protein